MFRQLDKFGSQRKVSVSAPRHRVEKPNLAFKAPTYENRDASFFPTRQGGVKYIQAAGPYLISPGLTVKILLGWITINTINRFYNLVKNTPTILTFLRTKLLNVLPEVDYIDLNMSLQFIQPSI